MLSLPVSSLFYPCEHVQCLIGSVTGLMRDGKSIAGERVPSLWISVDYGRFEIDLRTQYGGSPPHGGEPMSPVTIQATAGGIVVLQKTWNWLLSLRSLTRESRWRCHRSRSGLRH